MVMAVMAVTATIHTAPTLVMVGTATAAMAMTDTRAMEVMRAMATVMATKIPGTRRMVLHIVMEVMSDLFQVYRLPLWQQEGFGVMGGVLTRVSP